MATTNNFQKQLKELRINNAVQAVSFLRGKTIKIVKNAGGHNYGQPGHIITLDNPAMYSGGTYSPTGKGYIALGIVGGNTIYFDEFEVCAALTEKELNNQIKQLEESKKDLDKEIKNLKSKLSFMKANGLEEYDEDAYKVFVTLETLDDSKTTRMEKAKIIAALIKG